MVREWWWWYGEGRGVGGVVREEGCGDGEFVW